MWNYFGVLKYFRFMMSRINNTNKTIVVVLGATGTGKSKLALEIASKFNGEIINADSMQIYKGLDIATNKVSAQERSYVPHHMIDFLHPLKSYNVVDFRNATLPIIKRIHDDGKVPVIVGGTHYYVESILWNVLVQSECASEVSDPNYISKNVLHRIKFLKEKISEISEKNVNLNDSSVKNSKEVLKGRVEELQCLQSDKSLSHSVNVDDGENSSSVSDEINSSVNVKYSFCELKKFLELIYNEDLFFNEQLLALLETVDPDMASSYHPNNRRKVLRSLEVWLETGVRHSEHIRRQSAEVGEADLGGRIRFDNVAVLWVTCDQDVLDKRLDDRVDQMMKQGLLQELSEFHAMHYRRLMQLQQKQSEKPDFRRQFQKGIFQCIGFKEFEGYLELDDGQRHTEKGKTLYQSGIDMMKLKTRQYSRCQLKWIRNRFFVRSRMKIPVYPVDATDPSLWKEKVSPIAEEVVTSILSSRVPTTSPVNINFEHNSDIGDKTRHFCEVCQRLFIGDHQWDIHLKSAKHRKVLKRKSTEEQGEEKQAKIST